MIEKEILSILSDYRVYCERPPKAPKEWVLIERISQSAVLNGLLYETRIAVQSYGETLLQAAELDESVKNTLLNTDVDTVTAIRLNASTNFTDPETKEYRYQSVYDITHY